jgi:hypothetical protein
MESGEDRCTCWDGEVFDTWFDRELCPDPCGAMHTRCNWCGRAVDGCVLEQESKTSRAIQARVAGHTDTAVPVCPSITVEGSSPETQDGQAGRVTAAARPPARRRSRNNPIDVRHPRRAH